MLAQLFPRYYARYVNSPVAYWLEEFADWLESTGYARLRTRIHVSHLKKALEGGRLRSVGPDFIFSAESLDKSFAPWRRVERVRATRRAFQRFLVERQQFFVEPSKSRFSIPLEAYGRYLTEMRGYVAPTVSQHLKTIEVFLAKALGAEGLLRDLSADAVERFVVEEGRRVKRQSLQHIVARLRAFLRFCHDRGEIQDRLDAIDTPRTYRGELPLRAIPWILVQRLLSSIDRSTAAGLRDHAILHLMAHYGLRPSEIVSLTLASIDWQKETLRVEQSKTRSTLILPLADQSLRMLKQYLRCGRQESGHPELFLRLLMPIGPLKYTAVCDIFEKRARESRLRLQGSSSYGLRHAFAMRLLERGVGVKLIGDLLGHHTLESTGAYLRLQTEALRAVALPLPTPANGL
jgi:integrase/recombinase XerD